MLESLNSHYYIDGEERCLFGTAEIAASIELEPGGSPENVAKEGVESSRHDGQEIAHGWNGLSEDPCNDPENDDDGEPSAPSDDGMRVGVSAATHDSAEDVLAGDVGIESTNDDGRHEAVYVERRQLDSFKTVIGSDARTQRRKQTFSSMAPRAIR